MPPDNSGDSPPAQEIRLAIIIDRLVELRRRVAKLEGGDPDAEIAPLPENIAGLQKFVDDDHPACAHLREQFWNEIDGPVTALGQRLDRALKISAPVRRQNFRLIDGDRL